MAFDVPDLRPRWRGDAYKHLMGKLMAAQGGRCLLCHMGIRRGERSIDHFVPKALGGVDHELNLIAAHKSCNADKADNPPSEEQMRRFVRLKGPEAKRLLLRMGAVLAADWAWSGKGGVG